MVRLREYNWYSILGKGKLQLKVGKITETFKNMKLFNYSYLCKKAYIKPSRGFEIGEPWKLNWMRMKRSHSWGAHISDKDTWWSGIKWHSSHCGWRTWCLPHLQGDRNVLHWLTEQGVSFLWFSSSKSVLSSAGISAAFNSKWPIQK